MCGRLQNLKQTCGKGAWRGLSCRQTLEDFCVGGERTQILFIVQTVKEGLMNK